MLKTNVVVVTKGGAGSGFEGHAGRPGKVGGSAPSGTSHGLQVSDSFTGEIGMRAVVMNGKVYEGIEAMNGKVYEDIEAMGAYHTQIFARMVLDGLVPNSSLLETQSQLIVDTREPENSELESRVMALTDAYSVEIQREHFFRNATRKLLFVQDKYPPEGTISEGINKLFKRVQRDIQRGIIDVPNVSSIGINYSVAFVEIPIYEIDNIANIILSDLGHTFRYKQIVVTKGGAAMLLNQEMPPSTGTSRQSQGRTIVVKGGTGSGDYGHAGRPGEVGGSGPGGVDMMDPASGLPSRIGAAKQNWYRSWAKELGFKGKVEFQGSAPGSNLMGFYDSENGSVVIADQASKSGNGVSALAHEISHAKFEEIMTASANEDKRTSKFSSMWDKNEEKLFDEGKKLGTISEYAKSFWDEIELGDDMDLALNETFAEFSRRGRSETGRANLISLLGADSLLWQLYEEFGRTYESLH